MKMLPCAAPPPLRVNDTTLHNRYVRCVDILKNAVRPSFEVLDSTRVDLPQYGGKLWSYARIFGIIASLVGKNFL